MQGELLITILNLSFNGCSLQTIYPVVTQDEEPLYVQTPPFLNFRVPFFILSIARFTERKKHLDEKA